MSNGAGQRRRLAWAWSRVLLATMACVQAAPAVAQEPTEDVPCMLTNGMAQLHTEDSPASCADGCSGLRKSTLTFAGSSAPAFVLEQARDGEVLRIRCSHGFVSLSQPKGESLRVTPGTGVPPCARPRRRGLLASRTLRRHARIQPSNCSCCRQAAHR